MDFQFSDNLDHLGAAPLTEGALDVLNKNTLTTAGVLVAGSTGVAALALVATAIPAQIALASGISAGLIYAGDREDKGLPILPWQKKEEATVDA